jgi:hypothetical protein
MEIKSEYYAPNASRPCGEIITASLEHVIDELVISAGYNMDASLSSDSDHRRLISLVAGVLKKDFRFLPLYRVVEAFYRGSLGELGGTTRLTVRNIIIWVREIDTKHRQSSIEDSRLVKIIQEKESVCEYGAAGVRLKLQWRSNNVFTSEEWDKYPLEKIFELLKAGRKIGEIRPEEVRV